MLAKMFLAGAQNIEAKKEFINNSNYNPEDYNNEEDKMPETGAKNDIELADLRGVDYDDAKWDELLDNMTISDMDTVIALGGYQTAAASSVGKIQTIDCDGPASINNNFTGCVDYSCIPVLRIPDQDVR